MTKDPVTYILFGATGDLAQKKIVPALFNIWHRTQKQNHEHFKIVAVSRRPWHDKEYRDYIFSALKHAVKKNNKNTGENEMEIKKEIEEFLKHVMYARVELQDQAAYSLLADKLQGIENKIPHQRLFHLAIQPEFYKTAIDGLGTAGLNESNTKLLIEKPFGFDTNSAAALEHDISHFFRDEQVFRIDHYLAKPGLQALLKEKQTDQELEKSLSNKTIQKIHIRLLEKLDIQGRGEFYDITGVLRDVVQNHVMAMLATLVLDIPEKMSGHTLQKARTHIIQSLAPATEIVTAQYDGYRKEEDVSPDSTTETYVAFKTGINNERWKGVDIIIEAGKALDKKETDITVYYKDGSQKVFDIENKIDIKDAYEYLAEAAIISDTHLFASYSEIIDAWSFIDDIIARAQETKLTIYKKGESTGNFSKLGRSEV